MERATPTRTRHHRPGGPPPHTQCLLQRGLHVASLPPPVCGGALAGAETPAALDARAASSAWSGVTSTRFIPAIYGLRQPSSDYPARSCRHPASRQELAASWSTLVISKSGSATLPSTATRSRALGVRSNSHRPGCDGRAPPGSATWCSGIATRSSRFAIAGAVASTVSISGGSPEHACEQ